MTNQELLQRFMKISEMNSFPERYEDGAMLSGLPLNDIYQLGFAEAFQECYLVVREFVDYSLVQEVLTNAKVINERCNHGEFRTRCPICRR